MRNKSMKDWVKRFRFAWVYASSGRYMFFSRRNTGRTQLMLLELYLAQKRGESAVFLFDNGAIYTEKAHQNKLKAELAKHQVNTK